MLEERRGTGNQEKILRWGHLNQGWRECFYSKEKEVIVCIVGFTLNFSESVGMDDVENRRYSFKFRWFGERWFFVGRQRM